MPMSFSPSHKTPPPSFRQFTNLQACYPMEKKLVQVSEQEVLIDFALNCKCRANVRLTSLCATAPVAFKVQTSSPHKFLVKPPTGLIPPLCHLTFQVILKPQAQLPPTFPRSPSDRFLIRTSEFTRDSESESINQWFSSCSRGSSHDLKLKVAFVGPFLLRHAVTCGDYNAARNIIKRQRTILTEFPPGDAESLLQVATELVNPEDMTNLLLEAGLRIDARVRSEQVNYEVDSKWASNGHEEPQVAGACDRLDFGMGCRNGVCDNRRSIQHAAGDKDKLEMGELVLMAARRGDLKHVELLLQNGADINCCDQYGLTSLHASAIKGHKDIALMLIEFGLELECRDSEGHAPLHLAVVGGSLETVEMLVQNGANVNAKSNSGATPLYMATAMGYDDITEFLISRGG
ncbi:PREDICTED: ankyrin-3 [Prunus dulcis]|uniref:PREDICTED: ankyrin-3 n=2 Tax=Prunus dulcis TaxID=3755 RepID=A0A5E4ERY6_PRUDU|nr:PREDICTED: ankyrin-3 [Prunus dulcis]